MTAGLNLALAVAALADAHPHRPAVIDRHGTLSWAAFADRGARLAGLLATSGLGCTTERATLAGHECGQSIVGLMLHNGREYLEAMQAAFAARCAPANITWRASVDELTALLIDARCAALFYPSSLAATVGTAVERVARPPLLVEVGDETPRHPRAIGYEAAVASAQPRLDPAASPDDLYVLYTGGTTGQPKGTLWRQADFARGALGVRHETVADLVRAAGRGDRLRTLPAPPLIHGAAQWNAWSTLLAGGTVVIQRIVDRFDPDDVLDTAAAHRVTSLQIVGDAFARPLVEALDRRTRRLDALRFITSGGTALTAPVRAALRRHLPEVTILDILGSSESGRLAVATTPPNGPPGRGFEPSAGATVVDDSRTTVLDRDDRRTGWLATTGAIPLGYLGDPIKTAQTFPVIGGRRYSVPGDRARWHADGTVELLGRDAAVINTGGEKVFAEEVEAAIAHHPAVADVLVVGRPHPTLGSEICAVVARRPGAPGPTDLLAELRALLDGHLARYKMPRVLVDVDRIRRSPAGKPDYAWARSVAAPPAPGAESGPSGG